MQQYVPSAVLSDDMAAYVCAIALHERPYLDEWIRYHLGIGFDAVHIYDNSHDHELADLPGAYPDGRVSVVHYPVRGGVQQGRAYDDFGRRLGPLLGAKWAAFIDVDEFVVLSKHADVKSFLRERCESGSVSLNWYMYGSNGLERYDPRPVVQRFTRRAAAMDRHVKTIVHVPDYVAYLTPHHFALRPGTQQRDPSGAPFVGPFNPRGTDEVAHVNHYFLRSREEFEAKVKRGRADNVLVRTMKDFHDNDDNAVEDARALTKYLEIRRAATPL